MIQQQQQDYPCCVTPEFKNGFCTAPSLFEISANRVSHFIKNRKNIEELEIPRVCKNEIKSQYNKNKCLHK